MLLVLALLLAGCGGSGSSGGNENGPIAYIVGLESGGHLSARPRRRPQSADAHRARHLPDLVTGRDEDRVRARLRPRRIVSPVRHERGRKRRSPGRRRRDGEWWPQLDAELDEIVFDDAQGISSIGTDGSGLERIGAKGYRLHPAVSPDGKTIVFVQGPAIFAMNADGAPHTLWSNLRGWSREGPARFTLREPEWSPDGKHRSSSSTTCSRSASPGAERPSRSWTPTAGTSAR